MEGDRKYRQHGYMDSGREPSHRNGSGGDDKQHVHDPSAPRLPRMVEAISASRCWNCSVTLAAGADFPAACAKCGAELHCCKQCSYFEPSTRFQCLKPVTARVVHKDERNECSLFQPRVTVARDGGAHVPPGSRTSTASPAKNGASSAPGPQHQPPAPKSAQEARAAFDSLFKK